MGPLVIDDFLPGADYARLREYVQAQPMAYGSKSNSKTDPHGHWSWKPVHDNNQNLADLTHQLPNLLATTWNHVSSRIGMPMALTAVIRCYANGYTYGTDGYFHTDSERDDEHTVIIYICDNWELDWAGETCWLGAGNALYSAMPWPNRAIIIPSNQLHCARAVSRKCTALRTTFMYKVRKRRSVNFERLSQFLVAHKALTFKHSKGTLHDHLVRVFALLEARMLPTAVCFGGGLHSIYGTNVYQSQLLQPTPWWRSCVSEYFGQEAEGLAYMFSVLARPTTLNRKPGDGLLLKMAYDQYAGVTPELLRNLQMIEAANLADQGGLHNWPALKKLWDESKPTEF
jgi:SM-20-related protein